MGKFEMAEQQVDRRRFFIQAKEKLKWTAAIGLEHLLKPGKTEHLFPPGAVEKIEFAGLCTRCGNCQRACPNNAISPLTEGVNTIELGLPSLRPEIQPCSLCLECVEACPSGALTKNAPIKIGVAEVDKGKCMAWQGVLCGNCTHYCVHNGISLETKKPIINLENCIGCGKCAQSCLATETAIKITARQAE